MGILVINAGSSSLKLSFFKQDAGTAAALAESKPGETIIIPDWDQTIDLSKDGDRADVHKEFLRATLSALWQGESAILNSPDEIKAVGHRVVHGGPKYASSVLVTDEVISDLKSYHDLDPVHEPANTRGIEDAREILPDAKHVAVFDTAYHHNMPLSSQVYAGPYSWYEDRQIRRFGFHGINHDYCTRRVVKLLEQTSRGLSFADKSRVITCHLGGGASLCASLNGHSQMTTMGYTPLEGLMMCTRSGSIDPGLIFILLKQGYSQNELYEVLNKSSGLAGVSGVGGDLRLVQQAINEGNERAKLAFDIYTQGLSSSIAALIPYLGGLDALVFSGGIGEHSPAVRQAACDRLAFAGIQIDPERNLASEKERDISAPKAAVRTFVIAAGEEAAIASECDKFL
ncbi:MAG: acetate/propionate family kinase [Cyanobacteria bacterium REEB67]|nr:acetate/propionate family kinase [Cyanobacteria bacterium REEB67]